MPFSFVSSVLRINNLNRENVPLVVSTMGRIVCIACVVTSALSIAWISNQGYLQWSMTCRGSTPQTTSSSIIPFHPPQHTWWNYVSRILSFSLQGIKVSPIEYKSKSLAEDFTNFGTTVKYLKDQYIDDETKIKYFILLAGSKYGHLGLMLFILSRGGQLRCTVDWLKTFVKPYMKFVMQKCRETLFFLEM